MIICRFCLQSAPPRTDYWSLGVTLYELLAGELPWSAGDGDDISMQELFEKIQRRDINFDVRGRPDFVAARPLLEVQQSFVS
jgi:serine/threonine protein kinase